MMYAHLGNEVSDNCLNHKYRRGFYKTEKLYKENPEELVNIIRNMIIASNEVVPNELMLWMPLTNKVDLDDGIIHEIIDNELWMSGVGKSRETDTRIFSPCERIKEGALNNCHEIEKFIGPYLRVIPKNGFSDRVCLTSIECERVEEIEEQGIVSNPFLMTITLPRIKRLGRDSIEFCPSLYTINLPNCEYIDEKAIIECHSLRNINAPKAWGDREQAEYLRYMHKGKSPIDDD